MLSREEYEDYKKYIDNCVEEYHRGQHEAEVYYKNVQIPRERKETAEKILRDLYSEATSNVSETVELTTFQIEQLAKQFGVEIKE